MLAYVKAENAYADAMLAHIKPLETKVYNEIIGRLQQDDSTVPYLMNGYWYFRRFETGKEYPIYSRRADVANAPEEILLNVQRTVEGPRLLRSRRHRHQPRQQAHGLGGRHGRPPAVRRQGHGSRDSQGVPHRAAQRGKQHRLGGRQPDLLLHREGSEDVARATSVRSHRLDSANHTDVTADPLVWEQADESFYTAALAHQGREVPAASPRRARCRRRSGTRMPPRRSCEFKMFLPRERDHEYQVEHANGRWIVRTNWQAKNFRIVEVPPGARRRPRRSGKTSSRIAMTRSSTPTTCRAIFSRSKSTRAACASCAFGPGRGERRCVRHGR